MDDFINIFQTKSEEQLIHLYRTLLDRIHTVFSPPSVTRDEITDPISEANSEKGKGLWETRKEVQGWIFDGAETFIEIESDKHIK